MGTLGSLCTGYGGLDIAVEALLGTRMAWYSEIDKDACRLLAARFPQVPNVGDVKAVDWTLLEPVDVLTAGYPCQPFSHAGKRKGVDDPRHLWPFIRDAVRVVRPRLVVLENVAGHVSLGLDTVLGDLAEVGFDAEWGTLRAADVGACHARSRVWIVAADARSEPGGWRPGASHRAQEPARRGEPVEGDRAGAVREGAPADTDGGRLEECGEPDGEPAGGLRAPRRADAHRRDPAAPYADDLGLERGGAAR